MINKSIIISGVIGLVIGFLFAGILGVNFFSKQSSDTELEALLKDEEGFKTAYNLEISIYVPIYGFEVNSKIDNDDTFILYIGRDTCSFCQQFVPNLMEAAINQEIDEIFHVDTIDPSNSDFIDDENIIYTPTTYIIKNGVIEHTFVGLKTVQEIEQIIVGYLK